jgi:hypothetical protein
LVTNRTEPNRRPKTGLLAGYPDPLLTLNIIHIEPGRAIVGPKHLVREIAAAGAIDSIWCVNCHVDLDTDWTVY